MAKKSFKSSRKAIEFDIEGEEFVAHTIPGPAFVDLTLAMQGDDEVAAAMTLRGVFEEALDEGDFERFWKCASVNLSAAGLMEVATFLASESAGRPTQRSSPSPRTSRAAKAAGASSARVSKLTSSG